MFFGLLSLTLISFITSGLFYYKQNILYGSIAAGVGVLFLIFTLIYYIRMRNKGKKLDCMPECVPDCVPDCDDIPGLKHLDCDGPDCDCGGPDCG